MAFLRPSVLLKLPATIRTTTCLQCRQLHRLNAPELTVPKPTPFVPDVQTFLTLIGRGLSQHSAKIPTWEALFTLSGQQLKESGVEPARARRYLLWWRERFRNGIRGMGGDMAHVQDGVAELRIVEVPSEKEVHRLATLTRDSGTRKVVVNTVPSLPSVEEAEANTGDKAVFSPPPPKLEDMKDAAADISGLKIVNGNVIAGRGIEYVKGHRGVARLRVQEGLWEQKRGHKVDGGERRRAEVRAKRRALERKNAR